TVTTDIYFIEVRPFGREYRQGQQGGGGGGGGGQQDDSTEALSQRQKEIIAATFKLIRDKANFKSQEWIDNIHAIGQSQDKLADLFELELDQSKNQFETLQRGEMSQNSQEVDEAIRKLKELAERQQKMMERRAQQAQQGGGGGGDQMTAQELQKETEKLARQL